MSNVSVSIDGEKKDGKYDEWFLKSCAEKVIEAEEIRADDKLWKAVEPYLQKKVKAIKSLEDLREARRENLNKKVG